MNDSYYQAGAARAERVRDLFNRIAGRYDLINDLQSFGMHRAWKRRVARLAGARPGMSVLDVCCGTGDIARALADRGAAVAALDFSPAMLATARKRTEGAGVGGTIQYIQGDAQTLPFEDKRFDAVTMGYGLRNLADWRKGLGEMARVAKPGASVVVLDFGKPPNPVWRSIYFAYLRLFVPVLGKVFCGDAAAYGYILESLHHYPAQVGVRDHMIELGLKEVGIEMLLGGTMTINYGVA